MYYLTNTSVFLKLDLSLKNEPINKQPWVFRAYFKLILCALYSMTVFFGKLMTLVMVSLHRIGSQVSDSEYAQWNMPTVSPQ